MVHMVVDHTEGPVLIDNKTEIIVKPKLRILVPSKPQQQTPNKRTLCKTIFSLTAVPVHHIDDYANSNRNVYLHSKWKQYYNEWDLLHIVHVQRIRQAVKPMGMLSMKDFEEKKEKRHTFGRIIFNDLIKEHQIGMPEYLKQELAAIYYAKVAIKALEEKAHSKVQKIFIKQLHSQNDDIILADLFPSTVLEALQGT